MSKRVLTADRQQRAIIDAVVERIQKQKRLDETQRVGKARDLADALRKLAEQRLQRLAEDLNHSIGNVAPNFRASVWTGRPDDLEKSMYHSIPIIEVAKRVGCFANRRVYSSWVDLTIYGATRTGILIAFHALGRENPGLFVASGIASHRDQGSEGAPQISDIQQLTDIPFQFSYQDSEPDLVHRFETWLEKVVIAGLEYWQRSV